MRRAARTAAALSFVALVATGTDALAYCRSRTCNPNDLSQHCDMVDNCVTSGYLLYWNTSCMSFDAQQDGSPRRSITADQVTDVVTRSFAPWLGANCGSGQPAITVGTYGPVECDEVENPDPNNPHEYNRNAEKGANVVMFRDDVWPYPGSIDAYGLTTVTFNTGTGEIVDADIEVNSADFNVTLDGPFDATHTDLQSILTHEVGHFLGMAHAATADDTATMRANWDGLGTDLRTLSPDDEAGICNAFPPDRSAPNQCEPLNGFASGCHVAADKIDSGGCSVAVARVRRDSAANGLFAALGLFVALARRRRGRAPRG
ncbi:MAG TPA: matrixin family metalloprotease [Polyangiaceae bacterium]|nr:matrixin family metalloprotease [Polyangiaceae bacterium]